MKKKIVNLLTVLTVLASMAPMVAHATENEADSPNSESETDSSNSESMVFNDGAVKITVPERYEYLFDGKQSYRGDISEYGFDENEIISTITPENNMYMDALFVDGEYFCESYFNYLEDEVTSSFKSSLKDYSEDEIVETGKMIALRRAGDVINGQTYNYKDVYYAADGNPYIEMTISVSSTTDEEENFKVVCLYTLVDGDGYYYYTKSYDPEKEFTDLLPVAEEFVDNIEYTVEEDKVAETVASDSTDYSYGSSSNHTNPYMPQTKTHKTSFAYKVGRATSVGVIVGACSAFGAWRKKKRDERATNKSENNTEN